MVVELLAVRNGSNCVLDVGFVVGVVGFLGCLRCWYTVVFVVPPLFIEERKRDLAAIDGLEVMVSLSRRIGLLDMFDAKFVGGWFGVGMESSLSKVRVFDYGIDDVVVRGFRASLVRIPLGTLMVRLVSCGRLLIMVATAYIIERVVV